jgi:hypothetical protein
MAKKPPVTDPIAPDTLPVEPAPVDPLTPVTPPSEPAPEVHALESAPVNSKLVVVEDGQKHRKAVLATPSGAEFLPEGDPAHALPLGARIHKAADGKYVATQLSPALDFPDATFATASEAIAGFIPHFHPR